MAYLLKFGTYELPDSFSPVEDPISRIIAPSKLPRADGARMLTGYLDAKRLVVRGGILKGPIQLSATEFRTQLDEFRSYMHAGPLDLYYGVDDRYYRDVQVEDLRVVNTRFGVISEIEIVFVAADPFQYSTTLSTDTWTGPTNGGVRAFSMGGNAYNFAQPIKFVVGGAGSQTFAWTLKNQTTGEQFTLGTSGAGYTVNGGDTIEVDCLNKTVEISGVDKMKLFDGQFYRINTGSNSFLVTITSGTITSIIHEWRNRWWG